MTLADVTIDMLGTAKTVKGHQGELAHRRRRGRKILRTASPQMKAELDALSPTSTARSFRSAFAALRRRGSAQGRCCGSRASRRRSPASRTRCRQRAQLSKRASFLAAASLCSTLSPSSTRSRPPIRTNSSALTSSARPRGPDSRNRPERRLRRLRCGREDQGSAYR